MKKKNEAIFSFDLEEKGMEIKFKFTDNFCELSIKSLDSNGPLVTLSTKTITISKAVLFDILDEIVDYLENTGY